MNITQKDRILEILRKNKYQWVNARYFIQTMMISQAHARIFELQKQGFKIEASHFLD